MSVAVVPQDRFAREAVGLFQAVLPGNRWRRDVGGLRREIAGFCSLGAVDQRGGSRELKLNDRMARRGLTLDHEPGQQRYGSSFEKEQRGGGPEDGGSSERLPERPARSLQPVPEAFSKSRRELWIGVGKAE